MKRTYMAIDNIPTIITCACIVHNCEVHSERFNDAWFREVDGNAEFPQPTPSHARDGTASRPKQVRDASLLFIIRLI